VIIEFAAFPHRQLELPHRNAQQPRVLERGRRELPRPRFVERRLPEQSPGREDVYDGLARRVRLDAAQLHAAARDDVERVRTVARAVDEAAAAHVHGLRGGGEARGQFFAEPRPELGLADDLGAIRGGQITRSTV
jgi:hypothetical protein